MVAKVLILMILAGWFTAGCSAAVQPTAGLPTPEAGDMAPANPQKPAPQSQPPVPEGSPAPQKPLVAADVVFLFRRSGGLAGVEEEWTLYKDGRLLSNTGEEYHVTQAQIDTLLADLERVNLFSAPPVTGLKVECCDRFLYDLTVQSGERLIAVQAADGAQNVPEAVWDAIGKVQEFIGTIKMNA